MRWMTMLWVVALGCGGGRASDGSTADTGLEEEEAVGLRVERLLTEVGDPARGSDVYADACAGCHAASGYGEVGPMLVGTYWELDRVLTAVIAGSGDMPASGLADDELVDLMTHLEEDVLYEDLCRGAHYRCD